MKHSSLSFLLICVCLIIQASPKIVRSIFTMKGLIQTKATYHQLSNYYTTGLGGNVTINYRLNRNYHNPQKFIYLDLILQQKLEQYKQSKCLTEQSQRLGQSRLILKRLVSTLPLRTYKQQVSYIISPPSQTQQAVPIKYYLMLSLCQPLDLLQQMFITNQDVLKFEITWFNGQSPIARDQQVIEVYLILSIVALITNVWYFINRPAKKKYTKSCIIFALQCKLLMYIFTFIVANREVQRQIQVDYIAICLILARLFRLISEMTLFARLYSYSIAQNIFQPYCYKLLIEVVMLENQKIRSQQYVYSLRQSKHQQLIMHVLYGQYKQLDFLLVLHNLCYIIFLPLKSLTLRCLIYMIGTSGKARYSKILKRFAIGGFIYIILEALLIFIIQLCFQQVDSLKYQILLINLASLILLNYLFNQIRINQKEQHIVYADQNIQAASVQSNLQLPKADPAGSNQIANA